LVLCVFEGFGFGQVPGFLAGIFIEVDGYAAVIACCALILLRTAATSGGGSESHMRSIARVDAGIGQLFTFRADVVVGLGHVRDAINSIELTVLLVVVLSRMHIGRDASFLEPMQ
jgi:hypothetical protein